MNRDAARDRASGVTEAQGSLSNRPGSELFCLSLDPRLVERGLGAPLQACEIGVFAVLSGASVGLVSLALSTAFFLVSLLDPLGLLTIAFRDGRFSWSSDDALLSAFLAPTI